MDRFRRGLVFHLVVLLLVATTGDAAARPDDGGKNGPPEHANGKGPGEGRGQDGDDAAGPKRDDGPPGRAHGHAHQDGGSPGKEDPPPASDPPAEDPASGAGAESPPPQESRRAPEPVERHPHLPDDAPQPPVALFILETLGPFVLVDALDAFDPDGEVVAYHWDWGDGTRQWGSDLEFHRYDDPFVPRTITLRVVDLDGLEDTLAMPLAGAADPLVAHMDLQGDGDLLIADGYASDAGTFVITSWLWDWGDGTTTDGPLAEHHYTADGTYTVRLTVTDETGRNAMTEGIAHVTSRSGGVTHRAAAHVGASDLRLESAHTEPAPDVDLQLILALVGLAAVLARRR